MEFWRACDCGTSALVWYSNDDVWHERLLVYPARSAGGFYCLSPDGDFYVEDLRGAGRVGPSRVVQLEPGGSAPRGLAGRQYRFAEYPVRSTCLEPFRRARE